MLYSIVTHAVPQPPADGCSRPGAHPVLRGLLALKTQSRPGQGGQAFQGDLLLTRQAQAIFPHRDSFQRFRHLTEGGCLAVKRIHGHVPLKLQAQPLHRIRDSLNGDALSLVMS